MNHTICAVTTRGYAELFSATSAAAEASAGESRLFSFQGASWHDRLTRTAPTFHRAVIAPLDVIAYESEKINCSANFGGFLLLGTDRGLISIAWGDDQGVDADGDAPELDNLGEKSRKSLQTSAVQSVTTCTALGGLVATAGGGRAPCVVWRVGVRKMIEGKSSSAPVLTLQLLQGERDCQEITRARSVKFHPCRPILAVEELISGCVSIWKQTWRRGPLATSHPLSFRRVKLIRLEPSPRIRTSVFLAWSPGGSSQTLAVAHKQQVLLFDVLCGSDIGSRRALGSHTGSHIAGLAWNSGSTSLMIAGSCGALSEIQCAHRGLCGGAPGLLGGGCAWVWSGVANQREFKIQPQPWERICAPRDYLMSAWPLALAAVSPAKSHCAVAGSTGLAVFRRPDRRNPLGRWRLFGNRTQEAKINCSQLAWLGDRVVLATLDGVGSRDLCLVGYPRGHLDNQSRLFRLVVRGARHATVLRVRGNTVLLCADAAEILIFRVRGGISNTSAKLIVLGLELTFAVSYRALSVNDDANDDVSGAACIESAGFVSEPTEGSACIWARRRDGTAVAAKLFSLETSFRRVLGVLFAQQLAAQRLARAAAMPGGDVHQDVEAKVTVEGCLEHLCLVFGGYAVAMSEALALEEIKKAAARVFGGKGGGNVISEQILWGDVSILPVSGMITRIWPLQHPPGFVAVCFRRKRSKKGGRGTAAATTTTSKALQHVCLIHIEWENAVKIHTVRPWPTSSAPTSSVTTSSATTSSAPTLFNFSGVPLGLDARETNCVVWAELLDESHADTTISALRPRVAAAVRSLTPCVLGHFISQGKHTAASNYVRYSFENHNSSAHASALEWLLQAAVAVSGPAEADLKKAADLISVSPASTRIFVECVRKVPSKRWSRLFVSIGFSAAHLYWSGVSECDARAASNALQLIFRSYGPEAAIRAGRDFLKRFVRAGAVNDVVDGIVNGTVERVADAAVYDRVKAFVEKLQRACDRHIRVTSGALSST